mmetsp:Transcript_127134/g.220375  ORF Transcript_127134/g.220375 Transcript_127134/m.220375 type:complete len:236 (+) Transcript_127134:391-1098(+)
MRDGFPHAGLQLLVHHGEWHTGLAQVRHAEASLELLDKVGTGHPVQPLAVARRRIAVPRALRSGDSGLHAQQANLLQCVVSNRTGLTKCRPGIFVIGNLPTKTQGERVAHLLNHSHSLLYPLLREEDMLREGGEVERTHKASWAQSHDHVHEVVVTQPWHGAAFHLGSEEKLTIDIEVLLVNIQLLEGFHDVWRILHGLELFLRDLVVLILVQMVKEICDRLSNIHLDGFLTLCL